MFQVTKGFNLALLPFLVLVPTLVLYFRFQISCLFISLFLFQISVFEFRALFILQSYNNKFLNSDQGYLMSLIALISDFGVKDWFVGELKGVLYSIAPQTTIVDITHQIPPGDIFNAAFNLLASYKSFPKESIFCVATGISTETNCRSIVARTDDYTFIGPDNGVLSWVLRNDKHQIWCIENKAYTREQPSVTFQARDIFGPAAAHISRGISPDKLGPQISDIVRIPLPLPSISPDKLTGEIIYIDSFGNALTNICFSDLKALKDPCNICNLDDRFNISIKSQYQEVRQLEKLCYVGSAGFMEIAVREGSGADIMKISIGQKVVIR